MTICTECKAKIVTPATRLKRVNEAFHKLGLLMHTSIPYLRIDTVLQTNGFDIPSYKDIRCEGQYSRVHESVGEGKWLSITVYRFESGKYEIVAYVN